MAISSYCSIDSKYYKMLAPDYKRGLEPAKTVRRGVLGNTIVSIGPGNADMTTSAMLYIPWTPGTGYGTVADLQTAAEKSYVSYTDHISENGKFGQGTYNITILRVEVIHLGNSPSPETGYQVFVEWQKVL